MSWSQVLKILLAISAVAAIVLVGISRFLEGRGLAFIISCVFYGLIGLAVYRKRVNA